MPCSPAQLEANRRNARKSTGPRTEAGKAASRRNAFRHGLAGAGDLLGPGDDADLVAERAEALAEEWGVDGPTGHLLARRAAVLSARMERLAERAEGQAAADYDRAVGEFDARRRRSIDGLMAELAHGGDRAARAHRSLARDPQGALRLAHLALDLIAAIEAPDLDQDRDFTRGRALAWLDRDAAPTPDDGAEPDLVADEVLLDRLAAEAEALLQTAEGLEPRRRALALERHRAGLAASFDPGPDAARAQRYEAAAERGFFQSLRALRTLPRLTQETAPTLIPALIEPSASNESLVAGETDPVCESPLPEIVDIPDPQSGPAILPELGSFRAASSEPIAGPEGMTLVLPPRGAVDPIAHRRGRPDPRRLVAARR